MTTLALIIGAIALLALLLAFALAGLVYRAVTGDARETIQPLIPSHRNLDIIGDGAWEIPSQSSALIRDMPERVEA